MATSNIPKVYRTEVVALAGLDARLNELNMMEGFSIISVMHIGNHEFLLTVVDLHEMYGDPHNDTELAN